MSISPRARLPHPRSTKAPATPSASGAPCENGQPQAPSEVPFLSVFLKREPEEGLRCSRMRLARLELLRPLIPAVGDAHCLRVRPAKVGSRWTIWPQEDNHSGSQFGVRWPLPSVSPEPALHRCQVSAVRLPRAAPSRFARVSDKDPRCTRT